MEMSREMCGAVALHGEKFIDKHNAKLFMALDHSPQILDPFLHHRQSHQS